ncbi:MAG: amidohydrolase family protein [Planctomycetia bacterium]|nr:amidohydrolase family protein [Planctomycetia bacterium]
MYKWIIYWIITITGIITMSCNTQNSADLVITGGKVATVDDDFSITEAVAIQDDKIIFVGTNNDVKKYIGENTKIIELNGELVLPGLIDSHGHLTGYGKSLEQINLVGTQSYQEILDLVKEKVKTAKPGEWIRGRGWDQNDWETKEFPTHQALSKVSPKNPVILSRVDGHALLVNQKTMEIAEIDKFTPDPDGGKILRDSNGFSTGIFIDNAEILITDYIPKYSTEKIRGIIKNAANRCIDFGLTGVGDAGIPISRIDDYKFLIDNNELPIRINAMLSDTIINDLSGFFQKYKINSYGNNFLRVKSIKLYADGALGSRGAALLEPYSDDPENIGLIVTNKSHLLDVCKTALDSDFQVCTHAIGDKAIRIMLDVYEQVLQDNPKKDHRFRIEHSQIVNPTDIPRYAELGVIPAMQPQHTVSDMPWTEERIDPERVKGAYAFRSLLDEDVIIPCGSDFPVEVPNPLIGIHNAVTRQDAKGYPEGGWLPEQRMTIKEAIKGYTIWAAYVCRISRRYFGFNRSRKISRFYNFRS